MALIVSEKPIRDLSGERRLQDALYYYRSVSRHGVIIPNAVMSWGEVDLLSVTPAGFVVEHEIKISRADFLADRKKQWKHTCLSGTGTLFNGDGRENGGACPNYFFYAVPKNLIQPLDVPTYAGLIYITPSGSCEIAKSAPRLHSVKISQRASLFLAHKLSDRFWQMRFKNKKAGEL